MEDYCGEVAFAGDVGGLGGGQHLFGDREDYVGNPGVHKVFEEDFLRTFFGVDADASLLPVKP